MVVFKLKSDPAVQVCDPSLRSSGTQQKLNRSPAAKYIELKLSKGALWDKNKY